MWRKIEVCVLLFLIVACRPAAVTPTLAPVPTDAGAGLPSDAPPAHRTAAAFLNAWEAQDYKTMYALCSARVRDAIPYQEFVDTYLRIAKECTTLAVHPRLMAVLQEGTRARAAFHMEVETSFVGTFEVENELPLVWEDNRWNVEWSRQCIFRELQGDNLVHMISRSPTRANIYDVKGRGLAVAGRRVTVGVIPGEIEDEPALLARLSLVLGMPQPEIKARYEGQPPNWFIPVGDISIEDSRKHYELLSSEPGISLREKSVRTYRRPVVAPHVIGFMGRIPAEQVAEWQACGYTGDELIGLAGMEAWGEPFLAGQRGGILTIITPEGQVVTTLARREAVPARSIYLTLDYDFQHKVEELLGERKGAVVVMGVNDGRVLALASWPRFDPNLFAEGVEPRAWSALINDPARPLLNRAIQGQYPPGSTFKIVTMGTIMERGGVKATKTYQCTGVWNKLGRPMTCWLKRGHGTIDLVTALTASCDVTFYQIGYDLNSIDIDALPSYARSFGLGSPTGMGKYGVFAEALPDGGCALFGAGHDPLGEAGGLVPDDAWKRRVYGEGWAVGDTVNLAIGQGFLLTTPIQMCRLIAAIANGGILYRPQVVYKVAATEGHPEVIFRPERVGRIPITKSTLEAIRQGLIGATTDPRGTATHRFKNFAYKVAGKTGTAQNPGELPHAWFIGYLPADDPEIAIAVVLENIGEGSAYAAPLFRQVAAAYYGIEEQSAP